MFARWSYQSILDKERISPLLREERSGDTFLLPRPWQDGKFNLAEISFDFSSNEGKHYMIPQLLE